jgi:aconitate hydratase
VIIAESFARIHLQNLCNFGILPLCFSQASDRDRIDRDDVLGISEVRLALQVGHRIRVANRTKNETYETTHPMSDRQVQMVLAGGLINIIRAKSAA